MLKLILLLNPVYVTLFWAVVLIFYSANKGAPKNFLGKFMFVAFVIYLSHFFYFTGQFHIYRFLDSLYLWANLLVFPLYHIYIRLLTVDKKFSFKIHYKYLLIPSVVFVLHALGALIMTKDEQMDFYFEVLPGIHEPSGAQFYFQLITYVGRIVFVAQGFLYLIINFLLLIKNRQQLEHFYSNTDSMSLFWVQFFNISLAATSIVSVLAAIAGREAFADNTFTLIIPSTVFSALLFFIGLLGNNQTSLDTDLRDFSEFKKEEPEDTLQDFALKQKMESLFIKEKIFENPDLKIWDLSQMLGTNRTYISKFINSEYGRNFCNHVNYYRIQHVKKQLAEKPNISVEQLAEQSGFGSSNSLYRAFSAIEGVSMKQYRRGKVE